MAKKRKYTKYKWVENIGTPQRRDLSVTEFRKVYKKYITDPNWTFTLDAEGGKNAKNKKTNEKISWTKKYDFSSGFDRGKLTQDEKEQREYEKSIIGRMQVEVEKFFDDLPF
jgi:hypothetical protein